MKPALLWFRDDLRLADNPALMAALEDGPVLPLYVLDDEAPGPWALGGASRWWLHHALARLEEALAERGARLVLRRGAARAIIPELAAAIGAENVHAARSHEPWARARDKDVAQALAARGIGFRRHRGALLFAPESIRTKTGGAYGVYTPFARACLEQPPPPEPLPAPARIAFVPGIAGEALDTWGLRPSRPDWAGGLRAAWTPGEAGAAARLAAFLAHGLAAYDRDRDRPDIAGTSGLSAHLRFGEISPNQVWHAAARHPGAKSTRFPKEILWREFSAHLLWHHPDMPERPLRAEFERFPWRRDDDALRAWQRGRTGIPIVDAGMRQLWQTGWMHNRVRMIAASFLVKHLLLPWRLGEAWFWDTLVDADLANNAASWQWVGGCGADAAPYFRIFNPVLQGLKFDPDGDYVRRFVPELAGLAREFIHAPWQAPASMRRALAYPDPLCDLAQGRARALAAFAQIRRS